VSVETVTARLATLQATITGITTAYAVDASPGKLTTAHLPAFVNIPGRAEYSWLATKLWVQEARIYRMLLYVVPVERDADVARNAGRVIPFYRRVLTLFQQYPSLNGLSGVTSSKLVSDDGLDVLQYGGAFFAGIEFRLAVTETFEIAPVAGG